MTSDTQNSDLVQSKPPVIETYASYISDWFVGAPSVSSDKQPTHRDRGLWMLGRRALRQRTWQRLKVEYAESPRLRALERSTYDIAKQAMDRCGSLMLLIALSPLLLILCLVIRLDSPGPAFFRQLRVGLNGRRFSIWKFRTMYSGTPAYARSPRNPRDIRVTRIGRFLRRTSIDELPQLLNVLRGEMSLIGPRPEMPFITAQYTRIERQRLIVRPGMTGLWQISPARSQPIHHNLQCDLHYICNRNLLLDTAILLRTVLVVISGNGPD